jgi:DNA-binding NarL/FixJ family response regulator
MKTIEILIIDDFKGLSNGLAAALCSHNPDFIIYTAENEKQAVFQLKKHENCNLLLLDVSLGTENGLTVLNQLRTIRSDVKTLVFSMLVEPVKIAQALQYSIQGYITKSADIPEIARAIRVVASGSQSFCPEAVSVIQSLLTPSADRFGKSKDVETGIAKTKRLFDEYRLLTKKEQEIFLLSAQGRDTKESAKILQKAEKTVANQRSSAYQKLGVTDKYEAHEAAKMLGLV